MDKYSSAALTFTIASMCGAYKAINEYGSYQGSHFDVMAFFIVLIGGILFTIILDMDNIWAPSILHRIKPPSGPVVFSLFCYLALIMTVQALRTMNAQYLALVCHFNSF
jgi:hypothetical protein